MISFRIPRRLKLYRIYLVWVLLVSILPMVFLLAFSYHQSVTHARESLEFTVDRVHREVVQLLDHGEAILNRIALALETENPAILEILRREVYQSSYFREAGIIDEQGFLTKTSFGPVEPPIRIPQQHRSNPNISHVQFLGPYTTKIMAERSVILSLPIVGHGEVNLLVNPGILLYFLNALGGSRLGPDGFIAFLNSEGKTIAVNGMHPKGGITRIEDKMSDRIRISLLMPNSTLKIVGEISSDWVLRNWRDEVMVGAPLAILSLLFIFPIFLLFFNLTESFDYDIKMGIKNDEFEIHYQPIIDMRTSGCIGSEALVRWRHPEAGVLLPGLFIPTAERTGLIGVLGEWLMRKALEEQKELIADGHLTRISINLSPVELNSGSFDEIIRWLPDSPVAPEAIVFELTEAVLLNDTQTTALDILTRVHNLGARIALDDFGTGYSSLSHLDKFEFDYIKIDRHFVKGINQDIRTNSILEAIIDLGHKVGIQIVAEGVETKEQQEFLRKLGVQYAQGWLFSRPLPIQELKQYIYSRHRTPRGASTPAMAR